METTYVYENSWKIEKEAIEDGRLLKAVKNIPLENAAEDDISGPDFLENYFVNELEAGVFGIGDIEVINGKEYVSIDFNELFLDDLRDVEIFEAAAAFSIGNFVLTVDDGMAPMSRQEVRWDFVNGEAICNDIKSKMKMYVVLPMDGPVPKLIDAAHAHLIDPEKEQLIDVETLCQNFNEELENEAARLNNISETHKKRNREIEK